MQRQPRMDLLSWNTTLLFILWPLTICRHYQIKERREEYRGLIKGRHFILRIKTNALSLRISHHLSNVIVRSWGTVEFLFNSISYSWIGLDLIVQEINWLVRERRGYITYRPAFRVISPTRHWYRNVNLYFDTSSTIHPLQLVCILTNSSFIGNPFKGCALLLGWRNGMTHPIPFIQFFLLRRIFRWYKYLTNLFLYSIFNAILARSQVGE